LLRTTDETVALASRAEVYEFLVGFTVFKTAGTT